MANQQHIDQKSLTSPLRGTAINFLNQLPVVSAVPEQTPTPESDARGDGIARDVPCATKARMVNDYVFARVKRRSRSCKWIISNLSR